MTHHRPQLDWIATQQVRMEQLTRAWAEMNSGSYHLAGLRRFRAVLEAEFASLGGEMATLPLAPITQVNALGHVVELPMAEALTITKRPHAPLQVLLVGHMDTVFGADHPFQTCRLREGNILNGPGVADLKGGLVVMLHALLALEQSPFAANIGWQVLLNPDEEIGSQASDILLKQAAVGKRLGLVYEPALADGTLAGARKGSGNFTLEIRGRSAHAGRNPADGRNAIVLAAEAVGALFALNGMCEGLTVNPAKIEGGSPNNVVPDLALVRFNIRTLAAADEAKVLSEIHALIEGWNAREGFAVTLHGRFTRQPKPLTPEIQAVFDLVLAAGEELGIPIAVKPSGGCCDGNNLWKYGLPNVDTLGVRGANIHSADEIVYLDSLTERAQLSALVLMKLAAGVAL